ncbi:MAG: amidohydrolase [Synergistaceae bacterium]|nr:amidohydrolase [Synergistaceae bacterium]
MQRDIKRHPLFDGSRQLRLNGKIIIPGLCDAHIHLQAYAKSKIFIDLSGIKNKEDMLLILCKRAEKAGPDDWICACGLDETSWDIPIMPERKDLDSLAVPNPIFVRRACLHASVLNTRAMTLCGIDTHEKPNGIIVEGEQARIYALMERDMFSREKLLNLLRRGIDECSAYGLTTLFVCGAKSMCVEEDMSLYLELYAKGGLKARILAYHDTMPEREEQPMGRSRWIDTLGSKIFLDGSLGARTAALTEPYTDAPSQSGLLLYDTENLISVLQSLYDSNSQALVHSIGDAALDQLLDALEAVTEGSQSCPATQRLPLIVNHCTVCRPDQVKRMRRLGVAATVQPVFLTTDWTMAPARLGHRAEKGWAYSWKNLIDAGIRINGSSDCPADSLNPWAGIWAAVNRRKGRDVRMPEQCLTVDEALRLYTINPAKNAGIDSWAGSLESGKEADFAVLDRDIFSGTVKEREKVNVVCTVVGGRVVYGTL